MVNPANKAIVDLKALLTLDTSEFYKELQAATTQAGIAAGKAQKLVNRPIEGERGWNRNPYTGRWEGADAARLSRADQLNTVGPQVMRESAASQIALVKAQAEIDKSFGTFNAHSYNQKIQSIGQQYNLTRDQLDKMGLSVINTQKSVMALALRAVATIPIWMLLRTVYMSVINTGKDFVKQTIEQDTALAELLVVGKESEAVYRNLATSVLALGQVYGVAGKQAIDAAKLFVQQGLSILEVTKMTEISMLSSQLLGNTITESAENLTAAIRAYNVPVRDSIKIVDKWLSVQSNFAVTAKDLSEGMKTAGATAHAFGIELDTFNAHLVGIIETTRKSGSSAANALQMIYTRLLTTGAEAIQTIAKVPVYLSDQGEATFRLTSTFRDAESILMDVSEAFKTLEYSQKVQLGVMIGSRRQVTPFIALMENYDRVLQAQIVSIGASGNAWEAYLRKQESVAVKTQQLKASWSSLVNTMGDTGWIKGLVDGLNLVVGGLTAVVNARRAVQNEWNKQATSQVNEKKADIDRFEALKRLETLRKRLSESGKVDFLPDVDKEIDRIRSKITGTEDDAKRALKAAVYAQTILPAEDELSYQKKQAEKWDEALKWHTISRANYDRQMKKVNDAVAVATQNKEAGLRELDGEGLSPEEVRRYEEEAAEAIAKKQEEVAQRKLMQIEQQAKLMEIYGATEEQVLQYKEREILAATELYGQTGLQLKLEQERADNALKIANSIKEQADSLRGAASGGLKDWILGEGEVQDIGLKFGQAIREGFATSIAEGFTDKLFNTSGIDTMFGGLFVGLKDAIRGSNVSDSIEKAHKVVYNWIVKGHLDGVSAAATSSRGSSSAVAGWSGSASGFGGAFNGIMGYGGGEAVATNLQGQFVDKNGKPVGWSRQPFSKKNPGGVTKGQATGIGVTSALTGYSQYQSATAGGIGTGQAVASGIFSGAGSALMMVAAANSWNPVGWAIAAATVITGLLLGTIGGKKSTQRSVDVKTSEAQVSSKIDVTNKNLEIINRNLMALRTDIRSYILPNSAYFSEKRNIEDEFSIMSRRGYQS